MPNETETKVRQTAMEETQELPAFPARPGGNSGPEGDSTISAQYRALQEAQFLHEETLRQLRGEIQAQKQKISDLASYQGSAQPPARLDAILLRLSELERKIGEDATDPLINEIAHRLAALESAGGRGPDSRVERLSEQFEELRRRAAAPRTDPRTDEMALRIASVEGSLRRAQQAFDSEALSGQIRELQVAARETSEKAAAELTELRKQLADVQAQIQPDWSGRFDLLESRLEEVSEKREIEELASRLTQLEQSELEDQSAARVEAVSQTVDELAAKLEGAADAGILAELRRQMAALENQISYSSPGPLMDALSARIDQLQEAIEAQSASDAMQALQQRLTALESQNERSPDAGEAVHELRQRCDALAQRLSAIPEADVYDGRIAAFESKLNELSVGAPGVQELRERLSAIEKSGRADSDGKLAELTARLRTLELQAEQSSSSASDARIDRLSSRLDQMELTGGSSGLANQINELRERIAGLTSQLRAESAGPAPEAIAEIGERLALLESAAPTAMQRIEVLENRPTVAGSDQADAIAELRQRVDQLVNAGGSDGSAHADILHEIGMRVHALERNGDSGRGGSATANEEFNERIARLEAKIAENGGTPRSELKAIDSAIVELAELRAQLNEIQQNGAGPGVSENLLGKLAEKISSGIAGSEVKAIQMQMCVVYFFLALIGSVALSSFFMQ